VSNEGPKAFEQGATDNNVGKQEAQKKSVMECSTVNIEKKDEVKELVSIKKGTAVDNGASNDTASLDPAKATADICSKQDTRQDLNKAGEDEDAEKSNKDAPMDSIKTEEDVEGISSSKSGHKKGAALALANTGAKDKDATASSAEASRHWTFRWYKRERVINCEQRASFGIAVGIKDTNVVPRVEHGEMGNVTKNKTSKKAPTVVDNGSPENAEKKDEVKEHDSIKEGKGIDMETVVAGMQILP
jgi:hypothetical protein